MSKALEDLQRLSEATVAAASATLASARRDDVAAAYAFATELETWRVVLSGRPECALFDTAHGEYLLALLTAVQGQYRNGFKGLRLVLELHLQGVLLSTDLLALREWLASSRDTNWAQITGAEGVFGHRMVRAFLPAFAEPAPRF